MDLLRINRSFDSVDVSQLIQTKNAFFMIQ